MLLDMLTLCENKVILLPDSQPHSCQQKWWLWHCFGFPLPCSAALRTTHTELQPHSRLAQAFPPPRDPCLLHEWAWREKKYNLVDNNVTRPIPHGTVVSPPSGDAWFVGYIYQVRILDIYAASSNIHCNQGRSLLYRQGLLHIICVNWSWCGVGPI